MTEARIIRVVGPPGCGKTTYAARQARRAIERYGSGKVMLTSLTRAAAATAAGRGTGLPRQQIGTVHSHCYRALGQPSMIGREEIEEWNRRHPDLSLSADSVTSDRASGGAVEDSIGKKPGDVVFSSLDVMRARMIEPSENSIQQRFSREWEEFKRDLSVLDFTDLIELCLEEIATAPGAPEAIFADECQDLSLLELRLLEKWSSAGVDALVIIGDPFQALYGWRGASPDILAGEIHKVLPVATEENPRALSYRVPRAVHERAMRLIKQASTYDPRVSYLPRDEEGEYSTSNADWRAPEPLLQELGRAEGSLMILASCEYQLIPTKMMLRANGIPYHNPYTNRWNPLSEKRVSIVQSILRCCAMDYGAEREAVGFSMADLRMIDSVMLAKRLWRQGGKQIMTKIRDEASQAVVDSFIKEYMTSEAVTALVSGDMDWVLANTTKAGNERIQYAMKIARQLGLPALVEEPRVILGTIHSVKGGEADSVAVFPDLSPAAVRQFRQNNWHGKDSILRQFYVAATRSRSRLISCKPVWEHYVSI